MKKITDVVAVAFVSFDNGGKRRPIAIVKQNKKTIEFYAITSKFLGKSDKIRARYVPIFQWHEAGLNKPSFLDANQVLTLTLSEKVKIKTIGKLTRVDLKSINSFLEELE